MNNENEEGGISLSYAVEHEDRLDCKVPGACAVRSGDQHGEGADHECHEGCQRSKMGREVEAKEGEVEMQIIAHPDADGIEDEKQRALHFPN